MPYIDVTSVIRDQAVAAEPYEVVRRREVVNNFGRPEITIERIPAKGGITPTGDNTLIRESDQQNMPATIRVITTFRLRGESYDERGYQYQPDLVYWKGSYYLVHTTNSYGSYGAGFTDCECSSIQFVDPAND